MHQEPAAHTAADTASASVPAQGLIPRVIAKLLQIRLVRAFLHYSEHRGPLLADSVTHRTLFSIFAGVLLIFSIAGLWLAGNPTAWQALVDALDMAVPGLTDVVNLENATLATGLTLAGIASLVGLVGASIGAIASLRAALRILSDTLTDDTFFVWVMLRNFALALGIGVLLVLSAAIAYVGMASLDALGDFFGIASASPLLAWGARIFTVLVTFVLDTVVVAVAFRLLSGLHPSARVLWTGALMGGFALTVLQQLSGAFVGGASNNPLLTTFASLIALVLWLNLSSQAILIASAYIITAMHDESDRVHARFGASTFAQRRVQNAQRTVMAATDELRAARAAADDERESAVKSAAEKAAEKAVDQRA